jgi:methyl-accepting chemotaxis protein
MKIATRASLGFAVLALLVALVGGFSLQQMKHMNSAAAEVKDNWLPSVKALNDIGQNILRISAATLRLVVIRDAAAVKQNESLLNELKNDLAKAQKEYEGLISLDEER